MVLKVLEARHGREEMARINAREVRRPLTGPTSSHSLSDSVPEIPVAEREAEARCLRTQATRSTTGPSLDLTLAPLLFSADATTPDLQIRKRISAASSHDPSPSLSPSPPPPTERGGGGGGVLARQSSQPNRLSANRLNDILGIVQNAQNEVQNALKFRSGNNVTRLPTNASSSPVMDPPSSALNDSALLTPPSTGTKQPHPPSSSSSSTERRKQLPRNEMFAYSSDEDEEGGERQGGDHRKPSAGQQNKQPSSSSSPSTSLVKDSELEKTLETWLTKDHRQQERERERERLKLSSASSSSSTRLRKQEGEGSLERKGRSVRGGHEEREEEDDGGVADLQCLLADVLMSSGGEDQLSEESSAKAGATGSSLRGRFDIL
jgi:hypothetical protein